MDPSEIKFAADRMLGRLARLLRLLGYDTLYAPQTSVAELREIARAGERLVLTRGEISARFAGLENVFSLQSDYPPEQLREVVERFHLATRAGLWTRCTLCNGPIEETEKAGVESQVPPKVFAAYDQFFRCATCGHIYWRGSHTERILRNLDVVLGKTE
jgi:uncharacterized protein with PIN domain